MRASPSSIKTFQKCPRQWAFRYFGGFPREDKPWFAFGRELDRYGEEYLKTGARPAYDTPAARLFHEGIKHLPPPGTAATQAELSWTLDEHEIYGYADFVVQHESYFDGRIVLGDLKTTGNNAYDLNVSTLPWDPQCFGYAGALFEHLEVDEIWARWIYHDKRQIRARTVDVLLTRAENETRARKIALPLLDSMAIVRQANPQTIAEINLVPNDPTACDGCGKFCDYAAHCAIYSKGTLDMTSIQDRIAALKAQQANARGLAPEAAAVAAPVAAEIAVPPQVAQSAAAPQVAAPALAPAGLTLPGSSPPAAALAPVAAPAEQPTDAPRRGRPKGSKNAETAAPALGAQADATPPVFSICCKTPQLTEKLAIVAAALDAGAAVTVTL